MIVLGLHFGHDAAAAVLRDGKIASYVLRERLSRVKHAISLDRATVSLALEQAGIMPGDIDLCAVTSTQNIELLVDQPEWLALSYEEGPSGDIPCLLRDILDQKHASVLECCNSSLIATLYDPVPKSPFRRQVFEQLFPEYKGRSPTDFAALPWIDNFISCDLWKAEASLDQLAECDFSELVRSGLTRHGFHYGGTLRLDGIKIPAYYIHHHACHAASVYYQSGFDRAAIHSHDGYRNGMSYHSGMYYYAERHTITPVCPHHLALGGLYEQVGLALNLGPMGSPGKLMGLASYGQPRFFDRRFVGNHYDFAAAVGGGGEPARWTEHCMTLAKVMGYDMGPAGDMQRITEPINADIAASTQRLFEEGLLSSVQTLYKVLRRMELLTCNLCLTGGTSLNCPANTRVANESPFTHMFVEPGCDDSGLAVGAAQYLYHNLLDNPLPDRGGKRILIPYIGPAHGSANAARLLAECGDRIVFTKCDDAAREAARDVSNNLVIGWFEGRSEIGPRALGHRSIVADPRHAENWKRVNLLKGRHWWRPLAPAVLESEADTWFRGAPIPSPYMLYTALVKSSEVPAITHVDGSARIQTVNETCGAFFDLITEFHRLTGVPLVVNTSFNGPGEPIIETPQDALNFLLRSRIDAVYLMGFRVERARTSTSAVPEQRRRSRGKKRGKARKKTSQVVTATRLRS